jgi:peptidoglycan/LPS O-acetylase OafA/YrhL
MQLQTKGIHQGGQGVPQAGLRYERAHEIDGVRGWAALSVLLLHVFQEMLGKLLPILHVPWLAPFFAGGLAVNVFFVLSGDALTVSFFSRQAHSTVAIDRLLVRRYTRLVIPIFLSCLMVFLLRIAGLDFHAQATSIIEREDWLGQFINFDFSLVSLFRYSLIDVFTNHTRVTSYNPFLWTMSVEMIGSMLVFLMCYMWARLRNPNKLLAMLSLFLLLLGCDLGLFFAGMWIGSMRSASFFSRIEEDASFRSKWRLFAVLGCTGIVAVIVMTAGRVVPRHLDMFMACIFVFSVQCHSGLSGFFRNSISRFLGEISFPLYLVHFPILISFMSWLVIIWSEHTWENSGLVLVCIALATIALCLLTAALFRTVERFVLGRIDSRILKVLV